MNLFKKMILTLAMCASLAAGSHLFAADSALDESWQCPSGIPAAEAFLRESLETYENKPYEEIRKPIAMDIQKHGLEPLDSNQDAELCARLDKRNDEYIADEYEVNGERFLAADVIYYRSKNYYYEVGVYWRSARELNDPGKAHAVGLYVNDKNENRVYEVMSYGW